MAKRKTAMLECLVLMGSPPGNAGCAYRIGTAMTFRIALPGLLTQRTNARKLWVTSRNAIDKLYRGKRPRTTPGRAAGKEDLRSRPRTDEGPAGARAGQCNS